VRELCRFQNARSKRKTRKLYSYI